MGSLNYSHKLKWGAGDGEAGSGVQGGEREMSKEREALSGWLLLPPHFSSLVSLVWVCIM